MSINLLSKMDAKSLYNRLTKIDVVPEDIKPKRIIELSSILENVFRAITKNDLTWNANLFERMNYVFENYNVRDDVVDDAHMLRMLSNSIRHNSVEANIKDYYASVKSVAKCISFFSDTSVPTEVEAIYNPEVQNFNKENNNELLLSDDDLINNPTPRLAVCLVLDTSGSMSIDNKIEKLSKGVKMFINSVLDDELAKYSVEICVISFGGVVKQLLDFESVEKQVEKINKFNLVADGGTPMGEAVELALDLLEQRKKDYKNVGVEYYQPWLVLMTDGQPTDDITKAARLTNELIHNKKLSLFSIAIGDGANIVTLSKFSDIRPPLKLKGLNFVEFFEWLSQSTKATSQSTPGDSVKLPPVSAWAEL